MAKGLQRLELTPALLDHWSCPVRSWRTISISRAQAPLKVISSYSPAGRSSWVLMSRSRRRDLSVSLIRRLQRTITSVSSNTV